MTIGFAPRSFCSENNKGVGADCKLVKSGKKGDSLVRKTDHPIEKVWLVIGVPVMQQPNQARRVGVHARLVQVVQHVVVDVAVL